MRRLFIMLISLLLLAGCGRVAEVPEEPSKDGTTTAVTTTEAPTTEFIEPTIPALSYSLAAKPKNPDAKPFTKDDIAAIEANFKTVGDYVKAVPAAWYDVDYWFHEIIRIGFYDHKPEDQSRPFLILEIHEDILNFIDKTFLSSQTLPNSLLSAPVAKIAFVNFFEVGDAVLPPRGLKIGDNAQKIFDTYPDYRTGGGDILYDITALYPWAKPEWGNTEWDFGWTIEPEYGFLGGRIWKKNNYYIARFIFMEKPSWWDERELDLPWTSDTYSYYWKLDYTIEENIVQNIDFVLRYHPN